MIKENTVLHIIEKEDGYSLYAETLENGIVPELLNGESGFHVLHVRVLTELILREMQQRDASYGLTEEQINAMAMASSLHDIGKRFVPKSILESNERLSPVEYEIIKKHSALGEQMLMQVKDEDIDPLVLQYAKEIARSHHERYDGLGYPDGLSGDEIPISARAVSIADAYDALTSVRSYKEALSNDVAVSMIADGRCGVFDPFLVECLEAALMDRELENLRKMLESSTAVYGEAEQTKTKKVLLLGNVSYITKEFLEAAFSKCHVTIVGESTLKRAENLRVYRGHRADYRSILNTYNFDLILYFARDLSYGASAEEDTEILRTILKSTKNLPEDAKFYYFSSLGATFNGKSDHAITITSKENLCYYYARENNLKMKVVRVPYLYSGTVEGDFLNSIFTQLHKKGRVSLSEIPDSRAYFLSLSDFADLILRLTESPIIGAGVLNVCDEFQITFRDIASALVPLKDGAEIAFTEETPGCILEGSNSALRSEYGWFSKISLVEDIPDQYEAFCAAEGVKKTGFLYHVGEFLKKHGTVIRFTELIIFALISEALIQLTDSALFFSIVDFRMIYIVIMGTVHGLAWGIGAAALSSLSWLVAKIMDGTAPLSIFYEPTNWLPFIFFFLIGALCGYARLKNEQKVKFLEEEKEILEDKMVFLREIYTDTLNEKRDLKRQIVSSKDSFGKIYDITRALDSVEAYELNLKIIDTFENILENKSIAVYSINEGGYYARLEVASRDVVGEITRSVSLKDYSVILDTLKTGGVWKNTMLKEGLPMYAMGIYRDNKPLMLVFLWHASAGQYSLYYTNLFRILCDLAKMSLIRAHDYNEVTMEKQYIKGTRFLNAEAFAKIQKNFFDLEERKVFSYLSFEIDGSGLCLSDLNDRLTGLVRANDIMGLMPDGKIRILFSQASKDDLIYILPRFENFGAPVTVVKGE